MELHNTKIQANRNTTLTKLPLNYNFSGPDKMTLTVLPVAMRALTKPKK